MESPLALIGYDGKLGSLRKYVASSTQFENDYFIQKEFRLNRNDLPLDEAFSRLQDGDDDFWFDIDLFFRTPDLNSIVDKIPITVYPHLLYVYYPHYHISDFNSEKSYDLYEMAKRTNKQYSKTIVTPNFMIRQIAISIAQFFNQNVVLYMGDQQKITEMILDHSDVSKIDIHAVIAILKEKNALMPLSMMHGLGGVPFVYYETLDKTKL